LNAHLAQVEDTSSLVTMTIFGLNLASVYLMNYSEEQLRRKAHLENGGTLANYDRSHYEEKAVDKNETNNN
jgi:hypothetical protein